MVSRQSRGRLRQLLPLCSARGLHSWARQPGSGKRGCAAQLPSCWQREKLVHYVLSALTGGVHLAAAGNDVVGMRAAGAAVRGYRAHRPRRQHHRAGMAASGERRCCAVARAAAGAVPGLGSQVKAAGVGGVQQGRQARWTNAHPTAGGSNITSQHSAACCKGKRSGTHRCTSLVSCPAKPATTNSAPGTATKPGPPRPCKHCVQNGWRKARVSLTTQRRIVQSRPTCQRRLCSHRSARRGTP